MDATAAMKRALDIDPTNFEVLLALGVSHKWSVVASLSNYMLYMLNIVRSLFQTIFKI